MKKQKFVDIWNDSPVFQKLRDPSCWKANAGHARSTRRSVKVAGHAAFYDTGSYLAEEPYCIYQPKMAKAGKE